MSSHTGQNFTASLGPFLPSNNLGSQKDALNVEDELKTWEKGVIILGQRGPDLWRQTTWTTTEKGGEETTWHGMHKFIYHNSAIALPILDSQCKCWTFREKITSPGEGPDREKLSRLQWSDKEGEVKLSSEWHKSVWGRIDAQIILYAKTGTPQYITAPEQDIRAAGDTADPSLGVWFELCKGRNECVGGLCVLIIFYWRETIWGAGGGSEWPDLRLADKSRETLR